MPMRILGNTVFVFSCDGLIYTWHHLRTGLLCWIPHTQARVFFCTREKKVSHSRRKTLFDISSCPSRFALFLPVSLLSYFPPCPFLRHSSTYLKSFSAVTFKKVFTNHSAVPNIHMGIRTFISSTFSFQEILTNWHLK